MHRGILGINPWINGGSDDMIITGLDERRIRSIINEMDISISQTCRTLSRTPRVQVSLRAKTSSSVYARRQYISGYRSVNLCWHGFKDFITHVFDQGATRVQTAMGDWRSYEEFQDTLSELAYKNVGSIMHPIYLGDQECECNDPGEWTLW